MEYKDYLRIWEEDKVEKIEPLKRMKRNSIAFIVRNEDESDKIIEMIESEYEVMKKVKNLQYGWILQTEDMSFQILFINKMNQSVRGKRFDRIFITIFPSYDFYTRIAIYGEVVVAPIEFLIEKRMMIL